MAKARFEPGAQIETLTPGELGDHLNAFVREWFQEKGRGVGPWRASRTATIAGAALTLPGTQSATEPFGPQRGYAVGVRDLRVVGLSGTDSISVYRNNTAVPGNFIRTLTAGAPYVSIGKGSVTLRDGDTLVVTGTGLAATGDVTLIAEGEEVPSIDVYKLL